MTRAESIARRSCVASVALIVALAPVAARAERIASANGKPVPVFSSADAYCRYLDLVAAHGGDPSFDTGDPAMFPGRRLLKPGESVRVVGATSGSCDGQSVRFTQVAISEAPGVWLALPGNVV
jgi:hypothetical protein